MRAIPVKSFFNGKIKVNSYHRYIKRVDFVCCANNYACSKLSRLLTFLLRADVIDQVWISGRNLCWLLATEICMQEQDVGPCRGYFSRWSFDAAKGMCVPFTYGGCRGNRNNFERVEECAKTCEILMRGTFPFAPTVQVSTSTANRFRANYVVACWIGNSLAAGDHSRLASLFRTAKPSCSHPTCYISCTELRCATGYLRSVSRAQL